MNADSKCLVRMATEVGRGARWIAGTMGVVWTCTGLADPVTNLSVMSFNIWVQGGTSLTACVNAIRQADADLVGLQECDAATANTIASQLGYYALGVRDVSIVSRYPIVRTNATGGGSSVTVQLAPGQRVHLFNAHLAAYPYGPYSVLDGLSRSAVLAQEEQTRMPALRQLLSTLAPFAAGSEPCFLVGDFNAPSHLDYADLPWPTSVACEQAGLEDAYRALHPTNRAAPPAFAHDDPGITWTPRISEEPRAAFDRIDFIHVSRGDGVTLLDGRELDGRNSVSPWPSDHRAVWVRMRLTPPLLEAGASMPVPADRSAQVSPDVLLSWLPGQDALAHRLYLGTNAPGTLQSELTTESYAVAGLLRGATYYWRVDTVKADGVVTGAVWSFTTRRPAEYEWTFDAGDLAAALGSGVLAVADSATASLAAYGSSDGASVPHLNGRPVQYLRVPAFSNPANGWTVTFTESGPNGGGVYLNQFTLIWDVLIPGSLGWIPLFNTNPQNANDADFYLDPSGRLGVGAIGYSGASAIRPDTWTRVGFVADLEAGAVRYFVDGQKVFSGTAARDGRHSLYSSADPGADLLLFNEGDGSGTYTHPCLLSSFYFTDRALSDSELAAFGGAKARGVAALGVRPTAAIERSGAAWRVSWSGGEPPFTVQRSPTLVPPAWVNVVESLAASPYAVSNTGDAGFFRVLGQ